MLRIITIFFSSVLIAVSYNLFLLPHKVLSGGITGIAMIIGLLTPLNTGTVIFLLNIPILILGFLKIGKRFIIYSLFSVSITSLAMHYIPQKAIVIDPILSSVFGGVISGMGIGLIFRVGGSTGGFDIIGLLLTRKRDLPLGAIIFGMNAVVVLVSGFLFNFDLALYTMLSIYTSGRVIDAIHTRHVKLTLMIITSRGEEMKNMLMEHIVRGITIVDGEGAYTKEKRKILFTVITRYDLILIKPYIFEVDPHAFVNITETVEVLGAFRRSL
ncbi:YitT family protein [Tepidibacillus sp. LV47]|uniref:YitT family protein n=1 Tax=Tepidibacillus sp. LV47 TaxID=3398228 RepID=UPI003AAC4392